MFRAWGLGFGVEGLGFLGGSGGFSKQLNNSFNSYSNPSTPN